MRSPNPTSRGQIQVVAAIALGLIAAVGLAAVLASRPASPSTPGASSAPPPAVVPSAAPPATPTVVPLFQAAFANFNPWTEDKVDTKNPERGPLLILDGELDNTVPWAIANASYNQQKRNENVTEIQKVPGRGHSLTIDGGWREVADISLAFVARFVEPRVAAGAATI